MWRKSFLFFLIKYALKANKGDCVLWLFPLLQLYWFPEKYLEWRIYLQVGYLVSLYLVLIVDIFVYKRKFRNLFIRTLIRERILDFCTKMWRSYLRFSVALKPSKLLFFLKTAQLNRKYAVMQQKKKIWLLWRLKTSEISIKRTN